MKMIIVLFQASFAAAYASQPKASNIPSVTIELAHSERALVFIENGELCFETETQHAICEDALVEIRASLKRLHRTRTIDSKRWSMTQKIKAIASGREEMDVPVRIYRSGAELCVKNECRRMPIGVTSTYRPSDLL